MIKVVRQTEPPILLKKEAVWMDALRRASTAPEKERASKKYRHRQVQEALTTMFQGKCGYCESHIEHVSDPHIEHYRPKSKFPELTFAWENLLLACGKCNSTQYKGDKFPEADEGGPIINPCVDNPEDHFEFVYDATAKVATIATKTTRGRKTETLLGLNRNALRQHRSTHVTRLMALARFASTDAAAQQLLSEAKQDDAEYAAFARALDEPTPLSSVTTRQKWGEEGSGVDSHQ